MADTQDGEEKSSASIVSFNASDLVTENPAKFESPEPFLDSFKSLFKNSTTLTELIFKELAQISNFHFYVFGHRGRADRFALISSLDISFCPNVSDIGIQWITDAFPNLKKLTARGCKLITENSLRLVSSKCKNLQSAIFDMTSVRYIPTSITDPSIFSTKHCPIVSPVLLDTLGESLPSVATCKVVMIKTVSLRELSVTARLLKEATHVVGSEASGCVLFQFEQFHIIECVEDGANQLLLSENCLIILPYDGRLPIIQQLYSVENRLKFVASIIERFKAVCVPVFAARNDKDNHRSKKIKSLKEVLQGNEANAPFPKNEYQARYRHIAENDLDYASEKSEIIAWLQANHPFSDMPGSNSLLFDTAAKLLNDGNFSTVNLFSKSLLNSADALQKRSVDSSVPFSWASFFSLLAETGICWLENFVGFNNTLPGPNHLVASLPLLVSFINEFRSANDTTAMAEDVRCLTALTPLCNMSRVISCLKLNGTEMSLELRNRLFLTFEFVGLGIFRRKTALSLLSLSDEPPISVEHFVTRYNECSKIKPPFLLIVNYPIVTYPKNALRRLLAVMAKLLPPSILWSSGGFFYDSFFLEVLVVSENEAGLISVQFSADSVSSRPEIRSAMEASCSLIHTVCCAVLNQFAAEDLFSRDVKGLKILHSGKIDHSFSVGKVKSFSRIADGDIPRCLNCNLDVLMVTMLDRLMTGSSLNRSVPNLRKLLVENVAVARLPLIDCSVLPTDGSTHFGFSPVTAEIPSLQGLESIVICPDSHLDSNEKITLTINDQGFLTKCNVSDNEQPTTGSPASAILVEVSLSNAGGLSVAVSSDCCVLLETVFATRAKYISFVLKLQPNCSSEVNLPFFYRNCAFDLVQLGGDATEQYSTVKLGMRLEARNLKYPHMICAANIKKVDENNQYLIQFDGWSDGYSHWASLTSKDVFPCGFVEYLNKNPEQLRLFKEAGPFSGSLRTPRGAGFEEASKAFSWHLYFSDIKEQLKLTVQPVPYDAFDKAHLLGFPRDFLWLKQFSSIPDVLTLGSLCSRTYDELMETVLKSYQLRGFLHSFVPFVSFPSFSWPLCLWPSREKLTDSNNSLVYPICGYPGMHHFVNAAPSKDATIPLKTAPAIAELIAVMLTRMASQVRLLPDKTENLLPNLQGDVPFSYSVVENKNRTAAIENCLKETVIPCYLDYLLLSLRSTNAEEGVSKKTAETSFEKSGSLIAKASTSRTLLKNVKITSQSGLTMMPESEEDFFVRHEQCPRIMCVQHAFQYIRYAEAACDNFRPDNNFDKGPFATVHNSLLTQCLFTKDELATLTQPIASIHPLLTELYCGHCSLTTLPADINSLRSLSELILIDNQLTDLPQEFALLAPTLKRLDLSENKFDTIPDVVFLLKELMSLKADEMQLKNLSPSIGSLTKLRTLSLRHNGFANIPSELTFLIDLEVLDLSGVPLPMGDSLYYDNIAAFCRYNRIPMLILTSFTKWSTSSGARSDWLDAEGVDRLRAHFFDQIPRLNFGQAGFPMEILALRKLRILSLACQGITVVPDDITQLQSLRRLDLTDCLKLETISSKVVVDSLEMLYLDGCAALKTPPAEIRRRGILAVMAYFRRLSAGSVSCRRSRLMFVGLGGAGKTTLTQALTRPGTLDFSKGDIEITDGIDISEWHVPVENASSTIDFRLWDFAGQVVYYNTHQFFLSGRAIYLVIWNMRLGYQHAGLDFWLSSIACHAPQAPVLIIGTQADLVSQERSLLPEVSLTERFSSIKGFHYISSRTGVGIPELRQKIIEVALSQKHMGEQIPKAWLSFEENLLKARSPEKKSSNTSNDISSSVLMFSDTRRLADISGIFEDEEIYEALQFLSDLGSVQFFRNEFLCDRVIINPQWIVDVMACVVSVKNSPIKDGRLLHADIGRLWSAYPATLHSWLLKLTEAFDLAFSLKNQPVSIVPCLLPEDVPTSFNWPSLENVNLRHREMRLTFKFKYLPMGLFNRVQVRLCQFSDESTMWRVGSILRKNDHNALLLKTDSTTVQVKIQGPRPENLSFLILEVFDSLINEAFEGVRPEYLFSCPECVNARVTEPACFERSKIRRASELHVPFLQCSEYFHCVPIQELRQLLPAEQAVDFDCQLVRTVKQLSGLCETLKNDVLIIGCPVDVTAEGGETLSLNEFTQSLQAALVADKLQPLVISDPESLPFDQLAAILRCTKVVLCCVSPSFMSNDRCQFCLFSAQNTYKKQVVIAFIREFDWKSNPSLAFLLGSDIFIKAISRAKFQPLQAVETIKMRLQQATVLSIANNATPNKKHPPVFISYAWANSRDAVSKGTRLTPGAVGVTDPRAIKAFLAERNIDCWIDIEQLGRGALFEDIAIGLRNAKVVVVCVSDEYCESENCLREFRFATSACCLPVILCAVGTGCLWKTSEVTLVASLSARINFQTGCKENFELLNESVKPYVVSTVDRPEQMQKKPTLSSIELEDATLSTQEASLYFSEMLELAQRRFLRQLVSFRSKNKPYPRLCILDLVEGSKAIAAESPSGSTNFEDDLEKCEWCVRFFCEHEAGWHLTDVSLPIDASITPIPQILRESGAFLSRVLSLVRYSNTALPQLLSPSDPSSGAFCQNTVAMLEKLVKFEEPFTDEYAAFLNFVTTLDKQAISGGLKCCELTLGKELWLCGSHSQSTIYRSKDIANTRPTETEANVSDPATTNNDSFYSRSSAMKRMHTTLGSDSNNNNDKAEVDSGSETVSNSNIPSFARPFTAIRTSRACSIQ